VADGRRPYQAGSFRSGPSFSPLSVKGKMWSEKKPSLPGSPEAKSLYSSPAGKASGPASEKGEGQNNQ
jgi:hypothetical protein